MTALALRRQAVFLDGGCWKMLWMVNALGGCIIVVFLSLSTLASLDKGLAYLLSH